MEDYFETRISDVNGEMVAFFGVFDGNAFVKIQSFFFSYWFFDYMVSDVYCCLIRSWWSKNCRVFKKQSFQEFS